jgi:hypothetical protein
VVSLQRYVSKELTHFVGRKLPEEGQYQLLVKILTTGQLMHPPFNPNSSGNLVVYTSESICDNKMYNPEVICFCDIPLLDLNLHMRKYSNFGLSFLKQYLIEKGANPVFYIAKDSLVGDPFMGYTSRGQHFDLMIKEYYSLLGLKGLMDRLITAQSKTPGVSPDIHRLTELRYFLDFQIFSYLKCFDASRSDEDPDNYYMEREWRVIGHVFFKLKDVQRVILPKSYAERFQKDVPGYIGEKTFP